MKKLIIIIALFLANKIAAQTITPQQKEDIIQQIKKELLDSLRKGAALNVDTADDEQQKINMQKGEPFECIDMSWANGNDRRQKNIFPNAKYFVPSIMLDINYTHSFN